jgi:hypothetical protein
MKRFLTVLAFAGTASMAQATVAQSQNNFVGRALSDDMAREVVLESKAWTKSGDGGWHGTFGVAGQYKRNFKATKSDGLGARMGWSGTNSMSVGNNVAGGAAAVIGKDLDAYQMGLGPIAAAGEMKMEPVLYNAGADFLLYVGSAEDETGFFGKVHAPVGVASVDPKLTAPTDVTAVDYGANALNPAAGPLAATPAAYSGLVEAWAGGKDAGVFKGLAQGKIDGKRTTGAKFGDIEFALGYNFLASDSHHLGLAVRASGPTGNKQTGEYVMEPVFGNGGGWGLGGELLGHFNLWEGHDDKELNVWMDVKAMHLFKSRIKRSYDLKDNGAGSKYLLVADYNNGANQNDIQNLVNHSTLDTDMTVGAVVDGALRLSYDCCNWSFGLGYNFWGRTQEKLTLVGELDNQRFAVLGHQNNAAAGPASKDTCQPKAKMNENMEANGAVGGNIADATDAANRISSDALDVDAARQLAGWSSTVFAEASYRFMDSDYCPHVGLIASGEFSHSDNNALNQWGIGVHGGISF